jgi:D-methionine transport system ATP-binding protein
VIELTDLCKSFGPTLVLDGINFEVSERQIAAIVGPSGAGKSTLARCINLLERPTSGSVVVSGQELTRLRDKQLRVARRTIGTVFQSANLLSRLTAAQNVALPLRHAGLDEGATYQRVHELLDRVGLLSRASHYPAQLSGGQRQRVGIARGLALRPAVLLADEATSGLDPEATASILRLILELRDDLGVTVVMITHEMDVVRTVADTVAFLSQGRIVEEGTVAEVMHGPESALSRALLPLPPGGPDRTGLHRWELRYAQKDVDPFWASNVPTELGEELALLTALLEEVGGATVGRAVVGFRRALNNDAVIAAFARHGISALPLSSVGKDASPSADGTIDPMLLRMPA